MATSKTTDADSCDVLPMGWKEHLPFSFPSQFPIDKGTPEDEWEDTANPRKARRAMRLWSRGDRYVRICELIEPSDKDHDYALHRGFLSDPDQDVICVRSNDLESLVLKAKVMMRTGGYE